MNNIMQTYNELMNVKNPNNGLPIYFEYVSKYRRILVVLDGSTWTIKVSFKGDARHIKPFEKTYGDKSIAIAWAKQIASNRDILMGSSFTVKEAIGKTLIDRG